MATYDDADLLRAKLEALAEFAAGAGHEINNPLAVISGRAQLLLRDERDPERRRDLAVIRTQAMRIHEMIANLMLFARPPLPRKTPCDLSAIVAAAVDSLRVKAEAAGVRLERIGKPASLTAEVDAEQIQVAVRAVVDNGLNVLAPGGAVSVELRGTTDGAQAAAKIIVRDDGPGIAPDVREHLFDPFYSGREAGRGLGMGLSKAWRIATNHGGTLTCDEVESGAQFTLRLPLEP